MENKPKESPEDPAKRLLLKRLITMAVGATLLPNIHASDGALQSPEAPKIDERERLKKEILEKYGITVFDPEVPISSTNILSEYQRLNGVIPSEAQRIEEVDRYVATSLAWRVAGDVWGNETSSDVSYNELLRTPRDKAMEHTRNVVSWETESLHFVRSILNILPAHFIDRYRAQVLGNEIELYQIDNREKAKTEPLKILGSLDLVFNDDSAGSCICYKSRNPETHPSIILFHDEMQSGTEVYSRTEWVSNVLVHELTHLILFQRFEDRDGQDYDRFTQDALQILGIHTNGISQIPAEIIPEIIEPLIAKGEIEVTYGKKGERKYDPKTDVGYGGTNWDEFLPTATGNYIMGREFFLKIFSRSFGEVRAAGLYEFVKTEFFGGKEYEAGEIERAVTSGLRRR